MTAPLGAAARLVIDGREHGGTLAWSRRRSEGSPLSSAEQRATTLYSEVEDLNHDAVIRISAKLRGGGPMLFLGIVAMTQAGTPPPRTVIGNQSQRTD